MVVTVEVKEQPLIVMGGYLVPSVKRRDGIIHTKANTIVTREGAANEDQELLPGMRCCDGGPFPDVPTTTPPPCYATSEIEHDDEDDEATSTISNNNPRLTLSQDKKHHDLHSCNLEAIQLNNEGILLLMSVEKVEYAICCFRQSLASIKKLEEVVPLNVDHHHHQSMLSWSCRESTNWAQPPPPPLPQLISHQHEYYDAPPTILHPVQIYKPTVVDDFFYVCTKAFFIQPPSLDDQYHNHMHSGSEGELASPELLRASVIYNMALTLHVKGIQSQCRRLQQQSLGLYVASYRLVHDSILPFNTNHSMKTDDTAYYANANNDLNRTRIKCHTEATSCMIGSLLMACCNNMGHLAYYLGDDFGRSWRTMSNLQYLLTWFFANMKNHTSNATGSGAANTTPFSCVLLDYADIKGFQWNVKFMYPPTNASAA